MRHNTFSPRLGMTKIIACAAVSLALIASQAQAGLFDFLFKDRYTQTLYPIVLIHGMFGFDDILGVDYFYRIPEELSRSGADVFSLQVSALNSTEVRGEQAARQIEDILAITGASKVNIIGHSHGGPTARYVASIYPDTVASVTSVAGVNWGSRVADVVLGNVEPGSFNQDALNSIGEGFAQLIDFASAGGGLPQDLDASLASLSTAGSISFNQRHPQGMPTTFCGNGSELGSNGVRYFSWSGGTVFTNAFDLFDYITSLTALAFAGEQNDGLVSSCSSHLGRVLRDDFRQNHFDEVNQLLGLIGEDDPLPLYRQQANRLKKLGL